MQSFSETCECDMKNLKTEDDRCSGCQHWSKVRSDWMEANIPNYLTTLEKKKVQSLKSRIAYVRRKNMATRVSISKGGSKTRILDFPKYEDYCGEVAEYPVWYNLAKARYNKKLTL